MLIKWDVWFWSKTGNIHEDSETVWLISHTACLDSCWSQEFIQNRLCCGYAVFMFFSFEHELLSFMLSLYVTGCTPWPNAVMMTADCWESKAVNLSILLIYITSGTETTVLKACDSETCLLLEKHFPEIGWVDDVQSDSLVFYSCYCCLEIVL